MTRYDVFPRDHFGNARHDPYADFLGLTGDNNLKAEN
jgi:hypothetical protein